MNIIPFRGLLPNLNIIPDEHYFFESVKEVYNTFRRQDYFQPLETTAVYIFRMRRSKHTATGLICTTHIDDYLEGKVLRHEKTIRSKEKIQIQLLQERRAAVKPALLVHPKRSAIRHWLQQFTLENDATLEVMFQDGDQHTLWQVDDAADLAEVQRLYQEQLPVVAIADGHHRFASFASLYRQASDPADSPFKAVLTAYFPEDELEIEAFHRQVAVPDPAQLRQLLKDLAKMGSLQALENLKLPTRKHQMVVVSPAKWYQFDWSSEYLSSETPEKPILDVDLLHQHVLVKLLQVKNIRTDPRIHYLESTKRVDLLQSRLQAFTHGISFLLYPIKPVDFLKVANLGMTLVPKATFFQPRLKNGLIVLPLDQEL